MNLKRSSLILRVRSQTLVGGPDAKRGPFKFDPCKGNLEKFTVNIEFTCFSIGLTHNFYG